MPFFKAIQFCSEQFEMLKQRFSGNVTSEIFDDNDQI